MLADPLVLRLAGWIVPGLNVGMLITLAALAILVCYVVASWVAEAWFASKMRATIKVSEDTYGDLDQLARGPIEVAQAAVQRVDGWSVGVVLAGLSAITLSFGYIVVFVGLQHTLSQAWSISGIIDSGSLQRNLPILCLAILMTIIGSVVVGRACMRDRRAPSKVLEAASSWMSLAVTAVIGIATLYNASHMLVQTMRFDQPPDTHRNLLALGTTICIFLPSAWALLFWRRRENTRAGS
jgi:hypothetical protein